MRYEEMTNKSQSIALRSQHKFCDIPSSSPLHFHESLHGSFREVSVFPKIKEPLVGKLRVKLVNACPNFQNPFAVPHFLRANGRSEYQRNAEGGVEHEFRGFGPQNVCFPERLVKFMEIFFHGFRKDYVRQR